MSAIMIVALSISLVSVVFVVITLVAIGRARRFLAGADRVPGAITDMTSHLSRDRDTGRRTRMYSPVFSFTGPDGAEHRVTSTWSSGSMPTIGEQITVLVPRDDPQRARIDRFFPVWGLSLIIGVMTVLWLVAAGILIAVAVTAG